MLLEVAPCCYDEEEQAKIVAFASSLLDDSTRLASLHEAAFESHMMDAMLQAIGQLREWADPVEINGIDGRGLTAEQIVRSAGRSIADTGMHIINEEDLDVFFNQPDYQDPNGYTMDDAAVFLDGEEAHPDRYFFKPGRGRHRSDSQSR
ncbi:MAG: hypothetical protein JSS66_04745 [Armatimonadetes bacterium]|nr:hypothetical protein [Armatimonadota bacterium]